MYTIGQKLKIYANSILAYEAVFDGVVPANTTPDPEIMSSYYADLATNSIYKPFTVDRYLLTITSRLDATVPERTHLVVSALPSTFIILEPFDE